MYYNHALITPSPSGPSTSAIRKQLRPSAGNRTGHKKPHLDSMEEVKQQGCPKGDDFMSSCAAAVDGIFGTWQSRAAISEFAKQLTSGAALLTGMEIKLCSC